jgi:pimeloyl-ACP methyl ester carboxylesterase
MMTELPLLDSAVLPPGVRARFVENVNGLRMNVLEAGFEKPRHPCLLLLHGFPELAYSWRKVMGPLAAAGFHVVAPDQRGYGRTTGWDPSYDGDVASFRLFNLVRDALGLVAALGYRSVAAVIGHDFGSPVAAWCALLRPDVFPAVAMMSAPFPGPPSLNAGAPSGENIQAALAKLDRPRKHYQWYYSTRAANADMHDCPQGIHDFLRAYFHYKSADWAGNKPHPLKSLSAEELAQMPTYYIMDLHQDMAATVAPEMPSAEAIAACQWLPDAELAIYSGEFKRTGFQGACNGIAAAPRTCSPPSSRFSPAAPSTCRLCSSPARATGAPISSPEPSSACREARARACSAVTWSTAPATGCSRSSRSRSRHSCLNFCSSAPDKLRRHPEVPRARSGLEG